MDDRNRRNLGALMARWEDVQVVGRLMLDEKVSVGLKLIPVLAVLYLISPIDLIPDVLLGPGQLDDIGLILMALALFLRLVPPEAVARARGDESGEKEWVDGTTVVADEER